MNIRINKLINNNQFKLYQIKHKNLQNYHDLELQIIMNQNQKNSNINYLLTQLAELYKKKFFLKHNQYNFKIFNNFYTEILENIYDLQGLNKTNSNNINIIKVLEKLLTKLLENQGYLTITTNEFKQFAVGENLAITPGKVIFKNSLIELICYSPITAKVYKDPILFIPPCINKYYILDLSPNNSLIKWLIKQGFIVYIISWINPSRIHQNIRLTDYILNGILKSINVITTQHKHEHVHVSGYCIGGTLLNCAICYLYHYNNSKIISITNLMTLLDFSKLNNFINKYFVDFTNNVMQQHGYLDGRLLNMLFNSLPHKKLIWPYIINHYLLDQPINESDLMYWNADPCNLPAKMYNFYLKKICLQNKLIVPNGLKLNKIPINLKNIHLPIFTLAGKNDHISNWQLVYNSSKLYGINSNIEFVLTGGGHVKSIINPPNTHHHSIFYTNYTNKNLTLEPNVWLNTATKNYGSWWTYWVNWLTNINKEQINSNIIHKLINNNLANAPGTYVYQTII